MCVSTTPKKKPKPPTGGAAARLERELPYVVTLITIMAASGISPFGSFVKLARYKLLPNIMVEARKIVNQVHILEDPLTAMEKRAEGTGSRQYRDLLLGYVSTVRNGGDIASFLQNKMQSIFEYEVAIARQAIAKVGGLVDAYMIMQVIGLSLYVVVVALSSLPSSDLMPQTLSSPVASYLIVFVILPAISIAILYALDKTATISSSLVGTRRVLLRGVAFSAAAMAAFAVLAFMGAFKPFIAPAYAFPLFLAAASAWPAYKSIKMERGMRGVESEMPSYLRDIAESRKAGLSPEKCIIYASERHRDPRFQSIAKAFSNQLEWGVPLRKIYENLARTVRSRSALVHFRILIEAIESGGGYTASLDILAKSSESSQGAEREKASMLKPYFMIAFMVTALTSVTTLMVAQTFMDVGGSILPGSQPAPQTMGKDSIQLFSIGISAQSWMTGFLMGKISSGSFATGFGYALMLLAISAGAAVATIEFNISPSAFMGRPPAGAGAGHA